MRKEVAYLLLVLLLVACAGETVTSTESPKAQADNSTEKELLHIRLPMGYIPDPQYAPFYVADARGYFAEEGLEVEFDYSFETDGISLVGSGNLPFAIVSGEQVILARAQDIPVVYIMEWFQRYPIAVISKVEAGIDGPSELAGREVGLPGFFGASYVGFAGLLAANDLTLEDVTPTDIGFTQVEALLTDQTEAVVGYVNNEPIQLAARGVNVNVIEVADSTDLVANGLITNETMIQDDPDLVRGMVQAVLRGIADTLADPDSAFEISREYVENLDDNRRPVLEASLALWQADVLGRTDLSSWQKTQSALLAIDFLDQELDDLEQVFTNDFVFEVQP